MEAAAEFDALRPTLIRVAYRMLGSVADAEDVVQDAFLRWRDTDRGDVREPQAYLRRIVTRLCLDVLKSARKRREVYVGPWLPEPMVDAVEPDELDDAITLPLMMALDRGGSCRGLVFPVRDVEPEAELAVEAEKAYLVRMRRRWDDDELRDECRQFVFSFFGFWSKNANIYHLRNNFTDSRDPKMIAHRVPVAEEMIGLIVSQMGGDVTARTDQSNSMASAIFMPSTAALMMPPAKPAPAWCQ